MTRPQVIAAYRRAAELARAEGVDVRFYDGWTARGRPGLDPQIIVEHDTSDAAQLTPSRMLQILANGHGAIAGNAICTDAILRDGTVWVIASGLAWHAGNGDWAGHSGNARALGTEYQRAANQPLTDRQLEVGRIWTRARCAAFRLSTSRVCEHAEYATPRGRKQDRSLRPGVRLSGTDWRRSLTAPTVTPPPAPAGLLEEIAAMKGAPANLTYNQLLDDITRRLLTYRGTDGSAPRDVYGYLRNGSNADDAVLAAVTALAGVDQVDLDDDTRAAIDQLVEQIGARDWAGDVRRLRFDSRAKGTLLLAIARQLGLDLDVTVDNRGRPGVDIIG